MFASTFGDSHFDIEFGSIFDTPNFILPMKDCGEDRKEHVYNSISKLKSLYAAQKGYQQLALFRFINNNRSRWLLVIACVCVHKSMIT